MLEVLLYVGFFYGYVWFALPAKPAGMGWWRIALAVLLGAAPIALNLLHGDRAAGSGLRLDNIRASARLVVPVTIVMAAGVVAMGFVLHGWEWVSWKRLADRGGGYLVWGLLQQYLLQSFAMRRFMQARVWPILAVLAAATLFGFIHAPNWWLVGATTLAGAVWCGIFLRVPNILTLGLAHALLGVLLYHAWYWPTKGMVIGPIFYTR